MATGCPFQPRAGAHGCIIGCISTYQHFNAISSRAASRASWPLLAMALVTIPGFNCWIPESNSVKFRKIWKMIIGLHGQEIPGNSWWPESGTGARDLSLNLSWSISDSMIQFNSSRFSDSAIQAQWLSLSDHTVTQLQSVSDQPVSDTVRLSQIKQKIL